MGLPASEIAQAVGGTTILAIVLQTIFSAVEAIQKRKPATPTFTRQDKANQAEAKRAEGLRLAQVIDDPDVRDGAIQEVERIFREDMRGVLQ